MTAQLIPFDFDSHPVRALLVDDSPWFVAKDVCDALSIKNSRKALTALDEDEKGVTSSDTLGGKQKVSIISESGMYTLVLRCRDAVKPGSLPHRFRKWVTAELLPAVRKTGHYQAPAPYPIINGVNRCNLYGLVKTVRTIADLYFQMEPGLRALKSPFATKLHDRMVDGRMFAASIAHEHQTDMQAAAEWEADFHQRTLSLN